MGMQWKGLLLAVTYSLVHVNANGMMAVLDYAVAWSPPGGLRKDCLAWVDRCRVCSVQGVTKPISKLRSTGAPKPGYRMQMDTMDARPPGVNGETLVLTVVDVCTRYP